MSSLTMNYPNPAYRAPSPIEQRIEILLWTLDGSPVRTNLRRLLYTGLLEKPIIEKDRRDYILLAKLATAVAYREGYDNLARSWYQQWKGLPLQKCARLTSDPQIRKLLNLDPPPFLNGTGWIRYDWERFRAWLSSFMRRLAS